MNKDYLCACLNCNSVLIDHNPQVGAKQHEVPSDAKELTKLFHDADTGESEPAGFWGCPDCGTDAFLQDIN